MPSTHPHYYTAADHAALMAWYDAALAAISVPYDRRCLPTRYGETHTLVAGPPDARLPVVLLHGINVNAAVWVPQLNALAGDLRVIAPDVPGFAGRGSVVRLPYMGAAFGEWLADLLDALDIERALVVGSSAGGYFAMRAAADVPARVGGVVLANPCGLTPYRGLYQLTRLPVVAAGLRWFGRRVLARRTVARWMVACGMGGGQTPSDANVELAYLLLRGYRRRMPPPLLPGDAWGRVSAPVMLLSSDGEPYTDPAAVRREVRARLPGAYVATPAGVGHDINKEAPHLFNAAVRAAHAHVIGGGGCWRGGSVGCNT